MENIYTQEELLEMNSTLLQRGAPTQKDDIGYNKPDYTICQGYWYGLSDSQRADLSSRLVKYTKTQLSVDTSKLTATANYYNALCNNTNIDNGISVNPGRDYTMVSFRFNWDFINIVKTAKNRKYDSQSKNWFVSNQEIITILEKLEKAGADCKNAIQYLQENLKNEQATEVTNQQEPQKIQISVVQRHDKLELSFVYNAEIISAVKSLINRRYNPNNKSWTIDISEVNSLITKLQKVENIDITELTKYYQEESEQKQINVIIPETNKKPFEHQIQAAEFLVNKQKAILADEMGGGKTFSSILAAHNVTGKKLVVCPASLKLNWQKEINTIPNQQIEVINGKSWIDCPGWTIINYDILCKHIDKIISAGFTVAIFDEVHYCKAVTNSGKPATKRAKMFLEIAEKVDNVYLLTGTPITNHTKDIFNSLKAINHPLSRKFFAFGQYYCNGFNNGYGWDFNGSSNTAELHEKLKPYMLRRLKTEMLDLPEKTRSFIPVSINLKEYDQKVKEYMDNRESLEDKGKHLVYLNTMRHILAKEKVQYTIELAENLIEQGEQIVIITNYNFVVEKLMEKFGDIAVKLTGNCTQEQRQKAVDNFQTGNKKVFVGNIIAAGVGITLTASQNMIVNDYDWVPANHSQAEDRIHRIGQQKKVNINYVYANSTFDENITNLLEQKLNNISQIVDGKEESFLNTIIESL